LTVGQAAGRPGVEQGLNVAHDRDGWTARHLRLPRSCLS
jgi:hypothetical protein